MKVEHAPDVKERIRNVVAGTEMRHVNCERLVCFRSRGSKSCAIARIWSLPKIWQKALNVEPHYVIEVVSERYDKLGEDEKDKTMIHELLHIPKTFSGAVVSHKTSQFDGHGGHVIRRINAKLVEEIFKAYMLKRNEP
jgi:predicted metallopeptidase